MRRSQTREQASRRGVAGTRRQHGALATVPVAEWKGKLSVGGLRQGDVESATCEGVSGEKKKREFTIEKRRRREKEQTQNLRALSLLPQVLSFSYFRRLGGESSFSLSSSPRRLRAPAAPRPISDSPFGAGAPRRAAGASRPALQSALQHVHLFLDGRGALLQQPPVRRR